MTGTRLQINGSVIGIAECEVKVTNGSGIKIDIDRPGVSEDIRRGATVEGVLWPETGSDNQALIRRQIDGRISHRCRSLPNSDVAQEQQLSVQHITHQ
jgi:hypothetical protein